MGGMLNSWSRAGATARGLLALCVFALPASLAGAGGTPYGLQFVRLGQQWSDGGPAAGLAAGPLDADGQVEYQRQVAERELSGGPYSDSLAEPLAALALHYRGQADYTQAERLYRRALHVVRVNDGLYSERQIPILRELLNTYRVAGDMETLDERYEYFFRLYGKGRPPFTDIRLRAALEYLRWQREALRLQLGDEAERRLLQLYELNGDLLDATAADPAVDPALYRNLALSQLRNLYLIQDLIAPKTEKVSGAPPTLPIGGDWSEQELGQYRLETIQRSAINRGSRLLEELLARQPADAIEERARLELELADWYQWNGSERKAEGRYARVEELLRDAGLDGLLRDWLGEPVELPDNGAFWQPVPAGEDEQQPVVVQASFDVSASGRARDIEVRIKREEDSGAASGLRRKLSRTRFRPYFSDGEARAVTRLSRTYEIID
jgi:hypothetical protein